MTNVWCIVHGWLSNEGNFEKEIIKVSLNKNEIEQYLQDYKKVVKLNKFETLSCKSFFADEKNL